MLPFLLLLVGCTLQPITEPRRPNPETEPTMVPTTIAIEKPTYIVEHGSVSSQLIRSGRITPVDQQHLSFPINGQIETLPVSRGATVSAGDIVAALDTTLLEQSLQMAESELKMAQEQLTIAEAVKVVEQRRAEIGVELAQLQLDFAVEQAGETPTAAQLLSIEVRKRELELAELNLRQLDTVVDSSLADQVAQAQLDVQRIETQIAQSTLVAPISGTVTAVNLAAGDSVAADETVLIIADLTQVEVQLSLLDRELQELSEGMVAFGFVPSQPETSFPMTVRQLPFPYGTGAENDGEDGVVRLSFDEPTRVSDLSVGERIEVAILLARRDDVLWLPPAAIREFNGRLFVVVQEGETQRRLDIKIGLQNENQIEIVSGVSEGQLVIGP